MEKKACLLMENISKSFHGVKVLDHVNFELFPGEIHTLLGENGAGKSTLMKILCGVYSSDEGTIFRNGKQVQISSPAAAKQHGIGIVYQELMLAPHLTVAENIFMGREPTHLGLLDWKALNRETAALLSDLQIAIAPDALIQDLTVAQRQLIEIAKVLSQSPSILILDEPTSALADTEVDHLLDKLLELKTRGIAIIYISHRMDEIKRISDRVTVLRDGGYVGTLSKDEIEMDRVIRMMVGRENSVDFRRGRQIVSEEVVLEARHLKNEKVKDVSFSLHKGEILGFAGLIGAGRSETMCALFGIDPLDSGEVWINHKKCRLKHPQNQVRRGVGFAPEDRKEQALFLDMSVWLNVSMAQLYRSKSGIRNIRKEKRLGELYKEKFRIQTPSIQQTVKRLSGGNQQKVVISRWLANHPDILILDEPTRGIDVGAKSEIYEILSELVKEGMSIIVVSSELPELLAIADRILVMREGEITGELQAEDATQEKIMALATA